MTVFLCGLAIALLGTICHAPTVMLANFIATPVELRCDNILHITMVFYVIFFGCNKSICWSGCDEAGKLWGKEISFLIFKSAAIYLFVGLIMVGWVYFLNKNIYPLSSAMATMLPFYV